VRQVQRHNRTLRGPFAVQFCPKTFCPNNFRTKDICPKNFRTKDICPNNFRTNDICPKVVRTNFVLRHFVINNCFININFDIFDLSLKTPIKKFGDAIRLGWSGARAQRLSK